MRLTPITALGLIRSGVVLSDEEWKEISSFDAKDVARAIVDSDDDISGSDLQFLHEFAKEQSGEDYAKDISDAGVWDDDTLRGYAEFIKNSHYTYKPEATQIDSEIDPNEEHIGPMAQEIEKVNPACIEERPSGTHRDENNVPQIDTVKTVDTSRLALMNAGAIGDLARKAYQHDELLQKIASKLGVA